MSAPDLYGTPQVMVFKDGKVGAFSMQFDDSMETQAEFAIPHMNERGLVGTFFVNPDKHRYRTHTETWEVICPRFGHELGNHTMRHEGAKDYEEADHEIGESARHIWKLYPNRSKLRPFMRGGGTTWNVSREQMQELMRKYFLFRAPRRVGISDENDTGDPAAFAKEALEEGKWVLVGFHGVGGQWISCSEEGFVKLCDYLAANKDELWVGTTGDVYRYVQERDAVSKVALTDATDTGFKLAIECDEGKVNTYGVPFAELYDQPLTVSVRVPESWRRFCVEQDGEVETYDTIEADGERCARFDVRPNVDAALVRPVAPD
ncbi:MAG: polysaccharide deacetylase family protein [Candidatus Brocadiae bacterium]|nr:polysaccharide deacetylase family protein [Candidatus Brocadiia bacterium]